MKIRSGRRSRMATRPMDLPSYDAWLRRDRAKRYPLREPDPERLAALADLLQYADWIQAARVSR